MCHASPVDWCAIWLSSLKTSSHHIIFVLNLTFKKELIKPALNTSHITSHDKHQFSMFFFFTGKQKKKEKGNFFCLSCEKCANLVRKFDKVHEF